jgi:hypothetical protein
MGGVVQPRPAARIRRLIPPAEVEANDDRQLADQAESTTCFKP